MSEPKVHLVAFQVYARVLIALMILLIVTVFMAFFDLDSWTRSHHLGAGWNTAIAMSIAAVKGGFIVLFFMDVRSGSRLIWIFAAAGFVWLGIMLWLMMADYSTRNHPPGMSPKGEPTVVVPPSPVGYDH